ncbi:sonic hedgehog protein-like [Haliotis rubra]|uniref:sonic hedgehog protein-like n=1 Tax=Haliotis rubra TaxID=36100 RepID=UPI001EE59837|nr:sonic hedgehog protein-like [Haliotis rubra]
MKSCSVLAWFLLMVHIPGCVEGASSYPRLRLRHGPNKELILQRDVEQDEEEEDVLSVRKRCECRCRSRVHNSDWECCPCPWTNQVCFPGDATLTLEDGTDIPMKNLRAGHKVKTVANGQVSFTEVKTFLKRQPAKSALYLTISTASGPSLTLSGRHLVFVATSNNTDSMLPRFALTVKPGDYLFSTGTCGQPLCPALVTDIQPVVKEGVYVPLTDEGTVLVDGVFASCYSSIDHHIAHAFTAPFRWFPWLLNSWQNDGYSPLVDWLKQFGHMILPTNRQFEEVGNPALPQLRIEL